MIWRPPAARAKSNAPDEPPYWHGHSWQPTGVTWDEGAGQWSDGSPATWPASYGPSPDDPQGGDAARQQFLRANNRLPDEEDPEEGDEEEERGPDGPGIPRPVDLPNYTFWGAFLRLFSR